MRLSLPRADVLIERKVIYALLRTDSIENPLDGHPSAGGRRQVGSQEVTRGYLHLRASNQEAPGESGGPVDLLLGTDAQLEEALFYSEDSSTLNTSFIERHNLTIRQGCSYLGRRTPCHARRAEFLEGQVSLLMAYYNFLRPHRALKFGKTIRTPAMQAGLAKKRLSFRDVFTSRAAFLLFVLMVVLAGFSRFDFKPFQVGLWRRGHGSTTLA